MTDKEFDTKDTLLVISLYPNKGELYSAGTSGIASYTKNILTQTARPTVVLTNYTNTPSEYEEGNVLVKRCFKSNSPFMWAQLLSQLTSFKHARNVLIQFDFAFYGSILTSSLILPFLLSLKFLKKETYVTTHSVVTDIKKLKGHVGLTNSNIDSVKAFAYNLVFHTFYRILGMLTNTVIVLEEPLRKKLATYIPEEKILTIPHGVDTTMQSVDKTTARKMLGINQNEQVVLFFGFINWFKGADIFAKTFQNTPYLLGKKARFIIAGGESATLKNKAYYQKYLQNVTKNAKASKNISITGYVPQEKLALYFAAADLVVFPYRYFMSASGVLSLVFSHKKPFIVSNNISEMFDSSDFTNAMQATKLTKDDLTFTLNKKSFIAATKKVLKNGLKKKMIDMAGIIAKERDYKNTAKLYTGLIFQEGTKSLSQTLALDYN